MHPSGLAHIFHITMLRSLEKSAVETGSGEKPEKDLPSVLTPANGFIRVNTNIMYFKKTIKIIIIERKTHKKDQKITKPSHSQAENALKK